MVIGEVNGASSLVMSYLFIKCLGEIKAPIYETRLKGDSWWEGGELGVRGYESQRGGGGQVRFLDDFDVLVDPPSRLLQCGQGTVILRLWGQTK